MRKAIGIVALAVVAGLGLGGCRSEGPGKEPVDKMYMGPTMGGYNKVIVEPVQVTFDPTSEKIQAEPKDVEMLKKYMRDAVVKALKDGYAVVDNPGPGVMRLRITITDVKKSEWVWHLHWSTKLLGLGLGGATMQSTMEDSVTGASVGDSFTSQQGNFFQLTEGLSEWGEAKAVMDAWAKELRQKLDEIHKQKS